MKQTARVGDLLNQDNDALEASFESPESGEVVKVEIEGDPELLLATLEKKAQLAPRFKAAIETILISQTFAEDWQEFDAIMCLKSAGAERVGKNFPITFHDVSYKREDWTDSVGKAYRFVYEGRATMGGHTIYAMGAYGTRDPFLGKRGENWRALEEINPTTIQNAAYHIWCGNAIKALLGLRGIPKVEWEKMMARCGQDATKAGKFQHGKGTTGGTTADDTAMQRELAEICIAIANAGQMVVADGEGYGFEVMSEISDSIEVAKQSCINMSSFTNGEGKRIKGKGAKDLKGKWLQKTLEKARQMATRLESER